MAEDIIVVSNIEAINKNSLVATCDVSIKPWKMTMRGVTLFQKGENRWVGLPSRKWENDQGETKWQELIIFDDEGVRKRFSRQIKDAIDKFLETNPNMEPEPVILESQDLPF